MENEAQQNLQKYDVMQYHCSKCVYVNSVFLHLKKHIKDKHISDLLFCDDCRMFFIKQASLNRHLRRIHQPGKQWKCLRCNFRSSQYKCLEWHRRKGCTKSPQCHQCTHCGKTFSTIFRKKYHMVREHPETIPDSKTYKCNVCNVQFLYQSALCRHNLKHNGFRPYSCNLCDFKSSRSHVVDQHKLVKHLFPTKLRCSYCTKKFYDEKLYNDHIQGHLVHQCPECSFRASSLEEMTKHYLKDHQQNEIVKPLQCDRCLARLANYSTLKAHMNRYCPVIHKKGAVKPHQCNICLSRYTSIMGLKRHLKTNHGKLLCLKCSETFAHSSELDIHLKNSTCTQIQRNAARIVDKTKMPNQIKQFKCPACNEQFLRYKVLKRHLQLCVFK